MSNGFSLLQEIQQIKLEDDLQILLHPEAWPRIELKLQAEDKSPNTYAEVIKSKNPFALFVSDLHMSDIGRGDDFMLGHKNGPVMPVTPKTFLFAIALTFAMIRARQVNAGGVDLILNGDTVDIWELLGRVKKFAHQLFYRLLVAFANIAGNRVIYIPGNHDALFIPPPPPIVVSGSYWNTRLSTYATHGHQYDSWNKTPLAPNCPGRLITDQISTIEISRGNYIFPGPFPFCLIDNVKPLTYDTLRAYLWLRTRPRLRFIFNIVMKLFPKANLARKLTNLLGNLAAPEESDKYLENEANAIRGGKAAIGLPAGTGPSRIVFGHTHVPCSRSPYFNTGTWTPLHSIYWPNLPKKVNTSVETNLDLNPQLYIFIDPNTGLTTEEFHTYHSSSGLVRLGPPSLWLPNQIDALRRALYFD